MNEDFERLRPRLLALAYRLLGGQADAEDIVQELWLRWQQSAPKDLRNTEAWLVRVCSNACLDVLKSARLKRESYSGQWLPEPWFSRHDPEENCQRRSDLGQAYVWMLDNLTPHERVALALQEVFGWSYEDISKVLKRSVVNCRQLIFQARRKKKALYGQSEEVFICDRVATERFVEALASGSAERVVQELSPEVIFRSDGGGKAFVARNPIVGKARTSNFLATSSRKLLLAREVVWGGAEFWVLCRCGGKLVTAMTLVASDRGIEQIFAHRNPQKLALLDNDSDFV